MLDSLVRVSRRVLRVPETESPPTETRTECSPRLHGCRNECAGAPRRRPHIGGDASDATRPRVGPDARPSPGARARFSSDTVRRPAGRLRRGRPRRREREQARDATGNRAALRPATDGSRCLTWGEVHAARRAVTTRPPPVPHRDARTPRRTRGGRHPDGGRAARRPR